MTDLPPQYLEAVVSTLRDQGVRFAPGLTESELAAAEAAHGFRALARSSAGPGPVDTDTSQRHAAKDQKICEVGYRKGRRTTIKPSRKSAAREPSRFDRIAIGHPEVSYDLDPLGIPRR